MSKYSDDAKPQDFPLQAWVELCPSTDRWMMGDRFGHVLSHGRKFVHVAMNRSGKTIRVAPSLLRLV